MSSNSTANDDPVVAYALATGALLVAACVMCIILMCCARCPEWRRRHRQKRARRNLLSRCKKIKFSLKSCSKASALGDTCAICLEDFRDREKIVVCPCKHGYHNNCLSDWVIHSPCCPLCKSLISSSPLDSKAKEAAAEPSESTPLMA